MNRLKIALAKMSEAFFTLCKAKKNIVHDERDYAMKKVKVESRVSFKKLELGLDLAGGLEKNY